MRLALLALDALDKIDDSLYERFVAGRTGREDQDTAAASMRTLWSETFRAQLFLLGYCRKLDATRKRPTVQASSLVAESEEFGDLEAVLDEAFAIEASDIGDLVENLGIEPPRSDAERWADVLEKIAGIRYALGGQYEDATERMEVAIAAGHASHVLALLDELTSSSNEGIHALVVTVYEAFVTDFDPAALVPAYKTTLRRALMVRRGIASLLAELGPLNEVLQRNEEKPRHTEMTTKITAAVRTYVDSKTCRAMRAADRWELAQFDQRIQSEQPTELRLTIEGLVKYLESLNVVNQREVLVQHDRQVADDLNEAISTARELAELSARTAHEIIVKACARAQDLQGRNRGVDQIVEGLKMAVFGSTPADNRALLERLEQVLPNAGL